MKHGINKTSIGWLVIGVIAMMFSNGHFLYMGAALLYPALMLEGASGIKGRKKWIILMMAGGLGNGLSFWGMMPEVGIPFIKALPFVSGALIGAMVVVQSNRMRISRRWNTVFILPALIAIHDYMNATLSPFGGFGILGYSSYRNAIVRQLAVVVGSIGLSFIIALISTYAYWMIRYSEFSKIKRGSIIGIMTILILSGGFMDTVFREDNQEESMNQIAGIHTLDRTVEETANLFNLYRKDKEAFERMSYENVDKLLALSKEQAAQGADIISFAEATLVVSKESKNHVMERIAKVASEESVIMVATFYVLMPEGMKNENMLYIIDEKGEVIYNHVKYGGNMFEGSVEGTKIIRQVVTNQGVLSGIICWDKDFPSVVSQIGRMHVDTLFIPSADWEAIAPYHTIAGIFRGIENGVNIVTQTVNGESMMSDYTGRIQARMNHFDNQPTDGWVTVGYLPLKGRTTFYPYIQGGLIWLFVGFLIYSIVLSGLNQPTKKEERE